MTTAAGPYLSVVAPVYNEAAALEELAARCVAAARATGATFEVVLVDDGSTDATREVAARCDPGATLLHLTPNRGQWGATRAGLLAARGEVIVVLDGDLQDPPEEIPALVGRLERDRTLDVVFACKRERHDPLWFRAGRAVYGVLSALPGARALPPGAGAFLATRRATARVVAHLDVPDGNLAALIVALGARSGSHPYVKAARYDDHSRVGAWGLMREAAYSLHLTGAWASIAQAAGAVLLTAGVLAPASWPARAAASLLGAAGLVAGAAARRRARRVLDDARARAAAPPPHPPLRSEP